MGDLHGNLVRIVMEYDAARPQDTPSCVSKKGTDDLSWIDVVLQKRLTPELFAQLICMFVAKGDMVTSVELAEDRLLNAVVWFYGESIIAMDQVRKDSLSTEHIEDIVQNIRDTFPSRWKNHYYKKLNEYNHPVNSCVHVHNLVMTQKSINSFLRNRELTGRFGPVVAVRKKKRLYSALESAGDQQGAAKRQHIHDSSSEHAQAEH